MRSKVKKTTRIISTICAFVMLLSVLAPALSAFEFVYEDAVDTARWEDPSFDTDFAYSIAFVGDTQYITTGDRFLGTQKLKQQYKYIADTAEERKLAHVFVLGDITDNGYKNDRNLGAAHNDPIVTKEWEIAEEAIMQLSDAGVSYSICRGNHDDYMIDDYFNVPKYTDQFKDCGGFFSDPDGKHPTARETNNPNRYIYWSAKTGYHKESMVNSWKTMELGSVKYLLITVDFNPTDPVLEWLDELLAAYPDHRAIVTTHSYLNGNGTVRTSDSGDTMYHLGNTPSVLWDEVLANHPNVFMVVSGHVGVTDLVYSYNTGRYGNKVLQVLVDPQSYDTKEVDSSGKPASGIQDTGLVLYMNFSEDGNNVSFNYYSPLLNKFLSNNKIKLTLDAAATKPEWELPKFSTDHAYSFAFVGDTQHLTCGDYYLGTNKLETQYKTIADLAEQRKLAHVFVLGDITDNTYKNDANLSSNVNSSVITGEWEIAQAAITQLSDAGISYSICRGDHDDYLIDKYFNIPSYTDQYKSNGGFYTDAGAVYPESRDTANAAGNVYWNASTGAYESSIVNSWRTLEVCGTKYLFITIDYNPTDNVLKWVDETLAKYPDHRAIITTHSYLASDGTLSTVNEDDTVHSFENTGEALWNDVLKKHANVFIVVGGHDTTINTVYSYRIGDNGNKVLQVLVNPESIDVKEIDEKGTTASGRSDTGLVLYMNFSEDGNVVTFDYYATLTDRMLKNNSFTVRFDDDTNEDGDIDMANLEQFGQVTPLIEEKKTAVLDGSVKKGEYSYTRTIVRGEMASGSISSNLTEHFAYDDEYLYYAFVGDISSMYNQISLHFGSSLYTAEELTNNLHSPRATLLFGYNKCVQLSNSNSSTLIDQYDIFCTGKTNELNDYTTYEFKIRRGYLRENNAPDNLLSYTLTFDNGALHQYKLTRTENTYLKEQGVDRSISWTYNYVYFGTRPKYVEPSDSTETEDTQTTTNTEPTLNTEPTTTEVSGGGCGSTLSLVPVVCMITAVASAVAIKKRKED